MKKILFVALAAVFCFCSCMTSEEDAIYTIALSYETSSQNLHDADCVAMIEEFKSAINTIQSKNAHNWVWVETIFDKRFKKADAAAQKKYEMYTAEVKALFDTYQAKFDALPDKGSAYTANYDYRLYRSLNGDKELASTKFSVSYSSK